jgi:hypothetical protein
MATRRYADAFDDETVDDAPSHVMEAEFLSDDEEYCSSEEEEVRVPEPKYYHSEHVAALNVKYAKSLENCHEAVKDKLNWAADFTVPTPSTVEFGTRRAQPFQQVAHAAERRLKFGKPIPFALNVTVGPSTEIAFRKQVIDKLCKFIDMDQDCPFGDACKYSHDVALKRPRRYDEPPKNRMVTAEGKTKKIWMCKAFATTGKCKYGQQCAYAHSADEVKAFVTDCGRGASCAKIRRKGTEYENVGERKCMRLHPRERIANFISRTS